MNTWEIFKEFYTKFLILGCTTCGTEIRDNYLSEVEADLNCDDDNDDNGDVVAEAEW